jgi:hypothetical protein
MTDTRTNTTGDIIPLFGRARIDNDPEIRNRRAVISVRPAAAAPAPVVVDLTGEPKALFWSVSAAPERPCWPAGLAGEWQNRAGPR